MYCPFFFHAYLSTSSKTNHINNLLVVRSCIIYLLWGSIDIKHTQFVEHNLMKTFYATWTKADVEKGERIVVVFREKRYVR